MVPHPLIRTCKFGLRINLAVIVVSAFIGPVVHKPFGFMGPEQLPPPPCHESLRLSAFAVASKLTTLPALTITAQVPEDPELQLMPPPFTLPPPSTLTVSLGHPPSRTKGTLLQEVPGVELQVTAAAICCPEELHAQAVTADI